MPYEQDPRVLKRLIADAVTAPETRQKMEVAEMPDGFVRQFLQQRALEIWSAASKQIAVYNEGEKVEATAAAAFKKTSTRKPFYLRLIEDILPALGGFLFLALFSLFSQTVRHLVFTRAAALDAGVLVAAVFLLLVFSRVVGVSPQDYRKAVAALDAELKTAKEHTAEALAAIEPVLTAAIAANINECIDSYARPPFRLDLPEIDTSAYTEVGSAAYEIVTDAKRDVRRLLGKMNGGSLGIAGPRGSGKTTLLKSFCEEAAVDPKQLSIFATAPVEYDPREFLLQLFTLVCSQILSKETRTKEEPAWTQMDNLRDLPAQGYPEAGIIASIALIASVLLLFSGTIIALANAQSAPAAPGKAAQQSNSSPKSGGQTSANASAAGTGPGAAPKTNTESAPSPVGFFLWGVVSGVIGLVLRFSPGQPPPSDPIDFFFGPWARANRRRKEDEERSRQSGGEVNQDAADLVARTRRTLRGLRFQQSYSSGWSGSLKLPIGVEGGINAAVSFAERQLGLPEIVHEYRRFLAAANARYDQILIAIDELDKLESDEAAKKFLNGIKAVFGQEKVFYLISISENALSNFERRGLPIRDEFDSSFDDAIYIGYLDAVASRRLLARRAADPPPDVYRTYCYVTSGGLPRDLIRCCRKLYDYRRANLNAANDVATTCAAVTRLDIRAKSEAIRHNLGRVPDESRTAAVLQLLATPDWNSVNLSAAIVKLHESQAAFEAEMAKAAHADKDPDEGLERLAGILEEIKVYLCFSLAVTAVFGQITSETIYTRLEAGKAFTRLALARQWMSVNRAAALETIRLVQQLPFPPPGTVVVT